VAQAEGNVIHNDKGRCGVKVQMNVGNTSIESIGILASKSSQEPSIENDKPYEVEKNVDPYLMGSKSPMLVCNGKGKKQLMQDLQLPPCSSPSHVLFRTSSTTLDG